MSETQTFVRSTQAKAEATYHGILVRGPILPKATATPQEACQAVLTQLGALVLAPQVNAQTGQDVRGPWLRLKLKPTALDKWALGFDTLRLHEKLKLDAKNQPADLWREILVAMLMGPIEFEFPSVDELVSAVRIRQYIVQNARKTTLAFHTTEAERPQDCWTYHEDSGFTILPGTDLIQALTKATQPAVSGTLYAFSCYRATEYVTLLGLAHELAHSNPALLSELQTLWTQRAIQSGEFHEVFLREQGTMDAPLPPRYFVPGDRTWFRNPDEPSANASGYEGSWVMYLGGGLFTNFWKQGQPYTLVSKCVEIYHWRNAVFLDPQGDERIDEDKVDVLVKTTMDDPAEVTRIMAVMARFREPRGMYTDAGGCIDTTREFARWVRPDTADLVLPKA
jgi:Protein-glutamine gamma-glutamyltransferase